MGNEESRQITEEFRARYEKFLERCDSQEYSSHWDLDQYGEMDAYFGSDIFSTAVRLMAADGKYTGKEMLRINELLGTEYTAPEIAEIYEVYQENLDHVFEVEIEKNYRFLQSFDEELAGEYLSLIKKIGEIVIASDDEVMESERALIEELNRIR